MEPPLPAPLLLLLLLPLDISEETLDHRDGGFDPVAPRAPPPPALPADPARSFPLSRSPILLEFTSPDPTPEAEFAPILRNELSDEEPRLDGRSSRDAIFDRDKADGVTRMAPNRLLLLLLLLLPDAVAAAAEREKGGEKVKQ